MDNTSQWPMVIGVIEQASQRPVSDQRRARPEKEQALNCPRCNSNNTKFCYYNNYSLSQPRYICKNCKRYWTEGGTLRSVPVGGGSRKNKRSSSSSSSISSQISLSTSKKLFDHATSASVSQSASHQNLTTFYQGQDLNLGFPPISSYDQYNKTLELLNNGSAPPMGLSSLTFPMPGLGSDSVFPSEFHFQEFKPSLNFSPNRINQNEYANLQSVQGVTPRLFFPFSDLKQAPSHEFEQNRGQGETSGYWSCTLNDPSW